jgi:hypothetical protein
VPYFTAGDPQDFNNQMTLLNAQIDVTGAEHVDVAVSDDKTVMWVNVNGVCVLRVCRIRNLLLPGGEQT